MSIEVETWSEFEQKFNDELLPRMRESEVVCILWSQKAEDVPDVKIAVEFGLAVMLDKPIILIAYHSARIPTRLFDACVEVVRCDTTMEDPEFQARLRAAVERA